MKRLLVALIGVLAACAPGEVYRDTSVPMRSVAALDVDRYLGRWYEIARYPNSFEEGCRNVTATYGLRDDGRISVTNRCEKAGGVDVAEGSARIVAPGELKVKFVSWLPFEGDYWVLDVSEGYDLAVIGEPSGKFGWILAREAEISEEERQAALGVLERNGYDLSGLIWTEQE